MDEDESYRYIYRFGVIKILLGIRNFNIIDYKL